MRYQLIIFSIWLNICTGFAQDARLCKPSAAQSFFITGNKEENKSAAWQMQRFNKVHEGGTLLSTDRYRPDQWLKATVPGTILTSLVENGLYPDPYIGDVNKRNHHLIPDMADSGREFYHYWFRTTFKVPASFTGKRTWLKLHGINYRAEIWLNGEKLGNMAGMFITHSFDITRLVRRNSSNVLAINILPVDVPGQSGLKKERRTGAQGENHNGGDGLIGENVTMLMSAGWDFTFPDGVRDRNTGIWRDIEVYATDDIVLESPFVTSTLPLPDTSIVKEQVSVEAWNASGSQHSGIVKGVIGGNITFQKRVTLAAGEHKTIVFTSAEYPQLIIHAPKLWWPVNKGNQYLYSLSLSFTVDNKVSHSINSRFGIRQVSSDQHTPDSSRRFLVNGYPVFIRGTNWIPEAMLRNSPKRTSAELQYTRQAGLNLIRFWGGGITESDYFFDLCDEMGILLWTEFWLTGDTRYPTDKQLYLSNMEHTIKRIRNHASLAYYVSSNESTEIEGASALVTALDSTHGYQMQSECCGVHDGSPYKYENPMQYFENTASPRGSRVNGFNPEYGTPCLPTVESLREMMPAKDLWPINDSVWNYMDGGGFHQITTKYKQAVDEFGASSSIEEFAKKAQFVGALNYRAIWEVWNYNKFNYGDRYASGFLFWYHNSPIRQTGGRMYDWSLEPTAALYYSQNGLQPLHPQFDYLKNTVSVCNDYRTAYWHYQLSATVYDINAKPVLVKTAVIDIPADGVVKDVLQLLFPETISQVHFIKLVLKDAAGNAVSDAFYWRSRDAYKGAWTMTGPAVSGFQQLQQLPQVHLDIHPILRNNEIQVTLSNPSEALSFFTQIKLLDEKGKSIKPAFYTDNFFNLLPGESKIVTIRVDKETIEGKKCWLITDGWNATMQKKQLFIK